MLVPRQYQEEVVVVTLSRMSAEQPIVVVMPTGAGKSLVSALLAGRCPVTKASTRDFGLCAVLSIVHRTELVDDQEALYKSMGWRVEIEQAEQRADLRPSKPGDERPIVVIATIQTISKAHRLKHLSPVEFKAVLVDEAHSNSLSPGALGIFEHFASVPIVGFTATPQRPGLRDIYELAIPADSELAQRMTLKALTAEGWLTRIKHEFVRIDGWDPALLKVNRGDGDFTDEQLNGQFEGAEGRRKLGPPHRAIRVRLHERPGQALIFASSVVLGRALTNWLSTPMSEEDQEAQADTWREAGKSPEWIAEWLPKVARPIRSAFVDGETPKAHRRITMNRHRQYGQDFATGIQCVISVLVFTEGINIDDLSTIVMMRATALDYLYWQMMGRGARPRANIKHLLGQCATREERLALIGDDKCVILQMVPLKPSLDFVNPFSLLAREDPEFEPPAGGSWDDFKGTHEELLALLAEQKLAREQAAEDRALAADETEYERRAERSRLLVSGDPVAIREVRDLMGDGSLISTADLCKSYSQYKTDGGAACTSQAQFMEHKERLSVSMFDRAKGADPVKYGDWVGGIERVHWDRWQKKRMGDAYMKRSPGQWQKLESRREELYERYLENQRKTRSEADALKLAKGLYILSGGFSGHGVGDEADYWHHQNDPNFISHKKRYALQRKRKR